MPRVANILIVISLMCFLTGCDKAKPPQVSSVSGPDPTPIAEVSRAELDTPVKHEGIQIYIFSAKVEYVPLFREDRPQGKTENEVLIIRLDLENLEPRKLVHYRSWAEAPEKQIPDVATLHDNFGNRYKRLQVLGSRPSDSVDDSASLYPRKPVKDSLMFEKPIPGATHLDLELPAKNFGGEGVVRFRLPVPKK